MAQTSSIVEAFPPGTTRLIDVDGTVHNKHAPGSEDRDIVLIPRPSDDPEDPLNWTRRRKWLATSCVVVYTVMVAIPSSAVYSVVTPIRNATGLSLADINNGTGIMASLVTHRKGSGSVLLTTLMNSFFFMAGGALYGNRLHCSMARDLRIWHRWWLIRFVRS